MLVKVCGLTRPEDAVLADKLGADLLGLIFAESPRQVSVGQALKIIQAVDKPEKFVAVFVDETAETIYRTVNDLGIHWVQLHGSESSDVSLELEERGIKVIKAVRIRSQQDIESFIDYPAEALLFDNYSAQSMGGTGQTFDWSLLKEQKTLPKYFLSGGINLQNVEKAFREVHPAGVDISSSLESRPGIKNHEKLETFLGKVNELRYA